MVGESLYLDYWFVSTSSSSYAVSGVMAHEVKRALDRWPRRRWVRFVDLTGAVIRLRTATIESIEQCSVESRRLGRRIHADRVREAEWED